MLAISLPAEIASAEEQLQNVDNSLGDPALYASADSGRTDDLTAQRRQLLLEIEALYARWEALETIAEQARRG